MKFFGKARSEKFTAKVLTTKTISILKFQKEKFAKCQNTKCSTSTWKLLESHWDSCCPTATFSSRMSELPAKNGQHWSQVSTKSKLKMRKTQTVTSHTWFIGINMGQWDMMRKIREVQEERKKVMESWEKLFPAILEHQNFLNFKVSSKAFPSKLLQSKISKIYFSSSLERTIWNTLITHTSNDVTSLNV